MIRGRATILALCLAAAAPAGADVMHIGNSLTWDAISGDRTAALTDRTHDHHIRCGSSLTTILGSRYTCVDAPAGPWQDALAERDYTDLVLQPHRGATWQQEVDAVLALHAHEPDARLWVWATWRTQSDPAWDRAFDGPDASLRQHRAGYLWLAEQTGAAVIWGGQAFADLDHDAGLYRDDLHASYDLGRQLAAQTMADALSRRVIPEATGAASGAIGLLTSIMLRFRSPRRDR